MVGMGDHLWALVTATHPGFPHCLGPRLSFLGLHLQADIALFPLHSEPGCLLSNSSSIFPSCVTSNYKSLCASAFLVYEMGLMSLPPYGVSMKRKAVNLCEAPNGTKMGPDDVVGW